MVEKMAFSMDNNLFSQLCYCRGLFLFSRFVCKVFTFVILIFNILEFVSFPGELRYPKSMVNKEEMKLSEY